MNIIMDINNTKEQNWWMQQIFTEELKIDFAYTNKYFVSYILEGISKEQKETGQRTMVGNNLDPFNKLRLELLDEHNKIMYIKNNKEKIKKLKEINAKFLVFNKLANLMKKINIKQENPARSAFKKNTKIKSKRIKCVNSNNGNIIRTIEYKGEKIPYLLIDTIHDIKNSANGIVFDMTNKEMADKIVNFIMLHEVGHIYEFLKERVNKGAANLIDTLNEPDRNKVIDSEGKANAYALDNMYRKDRRELLKNRIGETKDFLNKKDQNYKLNKEYINGTKKHSKTYLKTLESIKKEKQYFNY